MQHWETLWTFSTANFTVNLECTNEDDPDLSWADQETLDNLERGFWVNVCFRVRVLYRGAEIGADYLGNSIYENVSDFRHEHVGSRGKWGSYFTDMVHEAVASARKHLGDVPKLRQI